MKKALAIFAVGFVAGGLATYFGVPVLQHRTFSLGRTPPQAPPVCYSCFWQGYEPKLRADVIDFYRQYRNPDPLVTGDANYILWRATGNANCDSREIYRKAAAHETDLYRLLMARVILGFGGPECGQDGSKDLQAAAELAGQAGLRTESELLQQIAAKKLEPRFEDVSVESSLDVPADPKTMILGESAIELSPGMRVGAQVDRVARDWISYQMKWDLSAKPLPVAGLIGYHEGALVRSMTNRASVEIYPLAGTIIAQKGEKWFAPDETGTFRFEVLKDKTEYPTTHAAGKFGWVVDTHGASAIVSQALERQMQLVVACGDSEGKVKAAYYLAQKGVNVVMPSERYADLLVGYRAKGVVLGTAPVKDRGDKIVVGDQPIRFSLREPIVVEDTRALFPVQYYDSGARYFRRLSRFVPLRLEYVNVDNADQVERILARAGELRSTAVGVRIMTKNEYVTLDTWLAKSRQNRAILFHSALYPYAQLLFEQYPRQVTFGDLHPRFE